MKIDIPDKPFICAVELCARDGMTDMEIAEKLDISNTEFKEYIENNPDLTEALRRGRNSFPAKKLEKALLKRAMGFRQQEILSEDMIDRKSGEVLDTMKRRTVTKEIAPDVRALLFWLKNRCPERWKDKPDNNETSTYEHDFDEQDMNL
jgi:predicted transcriptional regulator